MGEGGGGEEKGRENFFPSPLFFFRFHFSPFPQKRLILRLCYYEKLLLSKTVQLVTFMVKDYVTCGFT